MACVWVTFLFVLLFSASACDRCLHHSKATFTNQVSSGACGYGTLALGFNKGLLAGGLPSLFKGGAGCGDCFKVRCKNEWLCKEEGTTVIITDLNGDNKVDLVLGRDAFIAMANNGMSHILLNLGMVDIEYKRVPCVFPNQNLAVRVEDYSNSPNNYLALKILYQGGQTKLISIDIAEVNSSNWTSLNRNYGAIWDTNNVPSGALKFRFLVISGYDSKYLWTSQVLPTDWQSGIIYNTWLQVEDIAQESCSACDTSTW